jgi:hypothetical protein
VGVSVCACMCVALVIQHAMHICHNSSIYWCNKMCCIGVPTAEVDLYPSVGGGADCKLYIDISGVIRCTAACWLLPVSILFTVCAIINAAF